MFVFSDLVEEAMKIFMDDFSIYGSGFEKCLENLEIVLQRCKDNNLALNCEKMSFHGNRWYCLRALIHDAVGVLESTIFIS